MILTIPNKQLANTLFSITSMAKKGLSNECIAAGNQNVFPKAFAEGIEDVAVHPLWVMLL